MNFQLCIDANFLFKGLLSTFAASGGRHVIIIDREALDANLAALLGFTISLYSLIETMNFELITLQL